MPFPEQSKLQQDSLTGRAGDAVADLRERLAQFGRQIEQLRAGLPQEQAEVLARVERGIAHLANRVATIGQDHPARDDRHNVPASAIQADADEPWDAESAEALMRLYESEEAEYPGGRSRPIRPAMQETGGGVEETAFSAAPAGDHAWLDARLAGMSAILQQALAGIDPARPLAALDRRLDQFEQRLDAVLGDMALPAGGERLARIETRVGELATHLETTCRQLERLDAMDDQLRSLTQSLHERPAQAVPTSLNEHEIAALMETAAERALGRFADLPPASGLEERAEDHERLGPLEGLLRDYMTERRRSDEVTGGILYTIEGALTRLADRVDTIETANPRVELTSAGGATSRDGMEFENDRLAEAYAAGARALGREPLGASLDAADYAQPISHPDADSVTEAKLSSSLSFSRPSAELPEAQTRQELRASVMRAKLKAQTPLEEPVPAPPDSLDEATADVLPDHRTRPPERERNQSGLLLTAAIALMCGTGFLLVDSLLSSPSSPGMHQGAVTPPAKIVPVAGRAEPASTLARPNASPPVVPAASVLEPSAPAAPAHQAAPPRLVPEPATDDGADKPATAHPPGRRAGSTLPPAAVETAALQAPTHGVLPPLPATLGTADLRTAAAAGDASAQFDVASRYAEGNGAPQDHALAFAWLMRAAHAGLDTAQFRLGAYLEHGVGAAVDYEQARVWYRRAADQGNARAMHNLAVLSVGRGVEPPDYIAAAHWFRNAAERGLTDSQFNLAVLYDHGRGVPKDAQAAYKWYALASRSGDPTAARHLSRVRAMLDAARLKAIDQKIAAWQPIPPGTGGLLAQTSR